RRPTLRGYPPPRLTKLFILPISTPFLSLRADKSSLKTELNAQKAPRKALCFYFLQKAVPRKNKSRKKRKFV
ncbi:MAG: hypothetical protein IJ387_12980, partial [Thermoguttaceae bacterium]|nr:hypothetical protein [Thermoguttaceae bacterium]